MILRASITAWRKAAPWPDNTQVEQDLVLSRALVELFRRPAFAEGAVFRGGTQTRHLRGLVSRARSARQPTSRRAVEGGGALTRVRRIVSFLGTEAVAMH